VQTFFLGRRSFFADARLPLGAEAMGRSLSVM
jgi:hypothetical protein